MVVLSAIYSGDSAAVGEVLDRMDHSQTIGSLRRGSVKGMTPIMHAALKGNLDVFDTILKTMEATLTREQLMGALTTISYPRRESLVLAAADGRNNTIFAKTVGLLHGEVLKVAVQQHPFGRELLTDAARTGGLKTFTMVRTILGTKLTEKKAIDQIEPHDPGRQSILTTSVKSGNRHVVGAWAEVLAQKLPVWKMTQACRDSFSTCAEYLMEPQEDHEGVQPREVLAGMSVLFAYAAVASQKHLVGIAKVFPIDMKDCFVGCMSLVDNPFVAGMALSVALNDATPKARESQQVLTSLQNEVDELLLEVLERLPKSIKTFPKGLHGCAAVFEPETILSRPSAFEGPLRLALKEREFTETFCTTPLVFDYISHKFVLGLPNMLDSDNVIDNIQSGLIDNIQSGSEEHYLYKHKLVADTNLGKIMQGAPRPLIFTQGAFSRLWGWQRELGGTIRPGLQFIAVGILAEPEAYFKVPVMRMAMDFIVYAIILGVYTRVIIAGDTFDVNTDSTSADEAEALTGTEVFLAVYVTAAIAIEVRQILKSVHEYWQDKWNWLDLLALALLASGLYIRVAESDSVYGRAIYAMSAPLMFSRILFFAQIFPRQGLVIQMITLMIGEVAQFAVVLLIIMMGFTVGFVALFDEFNQSFGEIWVNVFNLMLGEVNAFEDNVFDNKIYEYVVRLMLVLYLIVMAVMLLNLLIAVLSTEHARIDEKKDREFSVSKVRMVKHYSSTVENCSVPAPLNLIQIAVWLPLRTLDLCFRRDTYGSVKRAVGVVAFWVITGPGTIALVWSLWIVSTPYAMARTWRSTTPIGTSVLSAVVRCSAILPLHLVIVPVVLVGLWARSGIAGVFMAMKALATAVREEANDELTSSHSKQYEVSVAEMLRDAPGGLGVPEIWRSLQDPTKNPSLLRDEQKRFATLADLKLLQTTLQASSREQAADLRFRFEGIEQNVEGIIEEKMAQISEKLDELFKKVR